MPTPYSLSLHIFRRDLRLDDNTALMDALASSKHVLPIFIFDPRQIEPHAYRSDAALTFMANSLKALHDELAKHHGRLYLFYGKADAILQQLLNTLPIDALFLNRDYTPFSRERDANLAAICKKQHVAFHLHADALLQEPENVLKKDGTPYTIFTPFFRAAYTYPIARPEHAVEHNYYQTTVPFEDKKTLPHLLQHDQQHALLKGGREEGLTLLKKITRLKDYEIRRNIPAEDATTHLSAHLKFGTVSVREVYAAIIQAFGKTHSLMTELYWRDFFTHIAFHFPHVFKESFHARYRDLPWSTNESHFNAWCEGKTGFPIVDAGMRQLNTTGFMHNRVRMIVGSFLTKDLHIDWRWGERYFAQKLIDYDPAVNNGNWQWVASTGCDAQPYFRIFNPWLQQQKFDPDGRYIKQWVPELRDVPIKTLHTLYKSNSIRAHYPLPMVDHALESIKTKKMYKNKSN